MSTPASQRTPFRWGFGAALGALLVVLLVAAFLSASSALTLIFVALYVSLGLMPVVKRLESWRLSRAQAVLVVLAGFLIVVALLIWLIGPIVLAQATEFGKHLPSSLDRLKDEGWFQALNSSVDGALTPVVHEVGRALNDPQVWLAVGGGALKVGSGVFSGIVSTLLVAALTIYFVAGHESMKRAAYSLVPRSRRPEVIDITETIVTSVGRFLGGVVTVAALNAVFTFLVLTIAGVRYAPIMAALAFPIVLIPMIGSVVNTALVTAVALFTSPITALVVLVVFVVYMQVEAYVLTPRIVGKAINLPGALVLVGALIGGSLFGVLGALIACPASASILLILRRIVVPAQDAK